VGHFYDPKTESLVSKIVGKNGKERNLTIKDARELGYYPSPTTIIGGVTNKDWLATWKLNLAWDVITNGKVSSKEEFLTKIESEASKGRSLGSDTHSLMEDAAKGKRNAFTPAFERIKEQITALSGDIVQTITETIVFDHEFRVGGTIDLGFETKDTIWIVDHKTMKKFDVPQDYEKQLCFYARGKAGKGKQVRTAVFAILTDGVKADPNQTLFTEVEWEKWQRWCKLARDLYRENNNL